MRFLCIVEEINADSQPRVELLQRACEKKQVEFVLMDASAFDYTQDWKVSGDDMIYRATRGDNTKMLQRSLLNDQCATFYQNLLVPFLNAPEADMRLRKGLNSHVIKTLPDLPKSIERLRQYVDYLGGFPVIVKALGSTHGIGIMKIDSWESFLSIADFLRTVPNQIYTLKQFIPHSEQGRLIVLGGKVIASHANMTLKGDFRSNTGAPTERQRKVKTYSKEIEEIAVRGVECMGLEFGGVDILIDDDGNPWVSEVNFPCFFPTTQNLTGIDIAGMMVDHLVQKIQKK